MRPLLALAIAGWAATAAAATSSRSVPSAFGGNGHNASFDGRLYIVRTGPGWQAYVLRPEAMTYASDGLPDASGPMWSAPLQILDGEPHGENALAICEADHASAPFACDAAGQPTAMGAFACYDVWVLDADASKSVAQGGQVFRRRGLTVRVADPGTPSARPVAFRWGDLEPLATTGGGVLHGIEATVARDGKLLVWNGSLNNGDSSGQMMYSVNAAACARSEWSAPRSLSHMVNDPAVARYRLAERQMRAADGTPYADGAAVFGAYPWLFPDGDGVIFAAALMPCRAADDPPGCGARRNATSVIGYATTWALANIDGGINPSTTDTVRLFFSSPGEDTFRQLPVTRGDDVWPFFGSNTQNYVEVSFGDALDGHYAGLWHMNESVTPGGRIDVTRTPDVSGHFNTARVNGAISFPGPNNGVLGKAAIAAGGWLEVAHDASLEPTDGITMELTIRPARDPDCDADNNLRWLLRKGIAYSLVFEETRGVRARVRVAGGEIRELYSGAVIRADGATWTKVAGEYDAATGRLQILFDDRVVAEETFAPALLAGTGEALTIGGIGARPACGGGGLNFEGTIDEVSVSQLARHPATASAPDAGVPIGGAPDAGNPFGGDHPGCSAGGPGLGIFVGIAGLLRRRRATASGRAR